MSVLWEYLILKIWRTAIFVEASCKVFTNFKLVTQRQDKIIEESKRRKEKAREGNKI